MVTNDLTNIMIDKMIHCTEYREYIMDSLEKNPEIVFVSDGSYNEYFTRNEVPSNYIINDEVYRRVNSYV